MAAVVDVASCAARGDAQARVDDVVARRVVGRTI
jgi:hypothetical protein